MPHVSTPGLRRQGCSGDQACLGGSADGSFCLGFADDLLQHAVGNGRLGQQHNASTRPAAAARRRRWHCAACRSCSCSSPLLGACRSICSRLQALASLLQAKRFEPALVAGYSLGPLLLQGAGLFGRHGCRPRSGNVWLQGSPRPVNAVAAAVARCSALGELCTRLEEVGKQQYGLPLAACAHRPVLGASARPRSAAKHGWPSSTVSLWVSTVFVSKLHACREMHRKCYRRCTLYQKLCSIKAANQA